MSDETGGTLPLTPGARALADEADAIGRRLRHDQLGVLHWVAAALKRHGPMAATLVDGLDPQALGQEVRQKLGDGEAGEPMPRDAMVALAGGRASERDRKDVGERDLVSAILAAAGHEILAEDDWRSSPPPLGPSGGRPGTSPYRPGPGGSPASAGSDARTLVQFGRNLTAEAEQGSLPPVVGRREEIALLLETLCRTTKRNPVLVGPAGVGKTAIVEGLAQRIAAGDVPEFLKGSQLWSVQPSALVAGTSLAGSLEQRVNALLDEAREPGVLLFIDEVHSIVGSGGAGGRNDIASLLKPALARGDVACIAATTDDEYRRFIEADRALERRFQPVRVHELDREGTLKVLHALRDKLKEMRGVEIADVVLERLVDLSREHMRNRHFPDKAVDLLEQCVANAVAHGRDELVLDDAERVVQRLVGIPLDPTPRLDALLERVTDAHLLDEDDAATLRERLDVTVRGLDVHPARPNAVLLLSGPAAGRAAALAVAIAETLFGGLDRQVAIDFGRFTHESDINLLLGAPPGYVGHGDSVPIHRIAQAPWSVLRCENVDACHPSVLGVLIQALMEGFFTDSRGRRIHLADVVVVLTANIQTSARRTVGFAEASSERDGADLEEAVAHVLGRELTSRCDVMTASVVEPRRRANERTGAAHDVAARILGDLAERYRRQGIELSWDEEVVTWIVDRHRESGDGGDWSNIVDEHVAPLVVRHVTKPGKARRPLVVRSVGGSLQVEDGSQD